MTNFALLYRIEDFKENGKSKKSVRKSTVSSSSDNAGDSEHPTKIVSETVTFSVNCQIHFIDFEGRSDAEAVLKILQEVTLLERAV